MVPAYLEQLPTLPVLPSGKTDRKNLPAPSGGRRLARRAGYTAPADGTERDLAGLLAGILRVERVSADSHFFDDLGADSLLMARFGAAIRARGDLPAVAMKDVYLHPTIRHLAAAISGTGPAPSGGAGPAQLAEGPPPSLAGPAERPATPAGSDAAPAPAGTPQYLLCGALQLLAFAGYAFLAALALNGVWPGSRPAAGH